jgi:murein endopeptidase
VSTAVALALAGVLLGMSSPAAGHHDAGSRVDWRQSTAVGTPGAGSLEHGVRFPAAGHHFFTWDPILHRQPNRDWRRWGTDDLVRATLRVLRQFARRHPHAPRIGVGDLSLRHGGYFGPEVGGGIGHDTHQNGLDVDVYYPRTDRRERAPITVDQVDVRLSQALVDLFVDAGAQTIYVGPNLPLSGPPGVVTPLVNHDNHLHFRIAP